jgi:enoyl-CoA hydratase/carnithine racemase
VAERRNDRLCLTLNRPEVRNAVSGAMRESLVQALTVAVADPSIREISLVGAGPAFCAGGDLTEFGSKPDPATGHVSRSTAGLPWLLAACRERLVAHVHGPCVGAGLEMAAFARRVTATPEAWFWLPELEFGLIPGAGGTASVAARIGRPRTAFLVLSGARIDAATACDWGLVDEIV